MPSELVPPRILGLALLLQTLLKHRLGPPATSPPKPDNKGGSLPETALEMAERHVADGERHVFRQREIVAQMTERSQPTDNALDLLQTFEELQREYVLHRNRLRGH